MSLSDVLAIADTNPSVLIRGICADILQNTRKTIDLATSVAKEIDEAV